MAKKLFVNAKTEAGLNAAITNNALNAHIAFIEEVGKEGIYANGKTYYTIPSDGKDGQILVSRNGKGIWADLNIVDILSYGVEWEVGVSDPELTRVGNINYHKTLPIQSGMKGCIFNSKTKEVVYWLNGEDWRFRKDPIIISGTYYGPRVGEGTYSFSLQGEYGVGQAIKVNNRLFIIEKVLQGGIVDASTLGNAPQWNVRDSVTVEVGSRLDGYDGEVMIYVPEFYIKSWDGEDKKCVRISSIKIDDSWEHQPQIYISAYRNTTLKTVPENMGYLSTLEVGTALSIRNFEDYCKGEEEYDFTGEEKLTRGSLGKCEVNISLENARVASRKANKEVLSYRQYKNIIYWLWVIEYATFNSQAPYTSELTPEGFKQGGMGIGATSYDDSVNDVWYELNYYHPIMPNGYTNELGNGTGIVEYTTPRFIGEDGETVIEPITIPGVRWRGLEDPFGHIESMLEGIIIDVGNSDSYVYTTNNPLKYEDTSPEGLTLSGTMTKDTGYIKEWSIGSTSEILPKSATGSSTTFKCDYCNNINTTANKIYKLVVGGTASDEEKAGLGYIRTSINGSSESTGFWSVSIPKSLS